MRILIAVHCFFPKHFLGTETYTLELAQGLIRRGHQVTVLSSVFAGEPAQDEEVFRYNYEGIPVISIDKNSCPNKRIKDTYYQPEHQALLARILKEENPDLLHVTHLVNHTAVLIEAAARQGIPILATFTDFFGFCLNNKLKSAAGGLCKGPNRRRTNCLACFLHERPRYTPGSSWAKRLAQMPWVRFAAEKAWAVTRLPGFSNGNMADIVNDIACRPDVLKKFYEHYRLAITSSASLRGAYLANHCRVPLYEVRFGVDIDRSLKPPAPQGSPLRVVFIGQIAYHKGTDLLIEAVRSCRPGSVRCSIYGSLEQEPGYVADLKKRSKGFPVEFSGVFPKEKMARILSEFDVLVIPSRWYENSPLVLLNALATHTPVIVADVPGLTEFIVREKNGFSFPLGSRPALARLLRELADVPSRVRNMSLQTAYPRSVEDMVIETEALQLQVAQRK